MESKRKRSNLRNKPARWWRLRIIFWLIMVANCFVWFMIGWVVGVGLF